ncbi:DUF2750 domain-containing protein [Aestuariibacter halophilus]|uniref:DUF2750 domain-containing protein n=1 Tax=Fluctibacter halophilus TaxID=226011 RepID=A0ABS8G5M1_9ALTE|nr:DUF2750 domain-containing protein [Aestuariibacter halophilus]MCC2615860.1 DUF2750 domain-containing protein [Aestuariibacter halophilus]
MSQLTTEQFDALTKLSPEARFDYTLATLIKEGQLWGLYGEKGWLLLQAEDDACLPVWPHEACAKAWEKHDFPDCVPTPISLTDWQSQWLPGMQKNGTLVLVFPLSEDEEGIMLDADEVSQCLIEEMDNQGSN